VSEKSFALGISVYRTWSEAPSFSEWHHTYSEKADVKLEAGGGVKMAAIRGARGYERHGWTILLVSAILGLLAGLVLTFAPSR
jgi:hypothetical protein